MIHIIYHLVTKAASHNRDCHLAYTKKSVSYLQDAKDNSEFVLVIFKEEMSEISKINGIQKASFRRITKQKQNRSKEKVN